MPYQEEYKEMIVDYLLIGYKRDGEIKRIEHEEGDMLCHEITFEPANDDNTKYPTRIFTVKVIQHLGNRYAIAIARDVTASEINSLIKSSGIRPVPEGVIGDI
ncbi:hypothetical protein AACK17_00580 [Pectobacterium punjabense]|uniref:hypothetical protein n=1 Tax=Pectobacterium punjabense TaxID=2108399 RepID=UPI00311FAAF6